MSLDWAAFANLPGSPESNFENLCRALIRRTYGQYGTFAALAAQPGVEFHLNIDKGCSLGDSGRWYGWQCRWYQLPAGKPLGSARRKKIEDALSITEKHLPALTDWILWTRFPLTKSDQQWFGKLHSKMRLQLWTEKEVDELLCGDAAILRSTYFGELILTPSKLSSLRKTAVAPISRRWMPETHQLVEAERVIRQILGEASFWPQLKQAATELSSDMDALLRSSVELRGHDREAVLEMGTVCAGIASALFKLATALTKGDLELATEPVNTSPWLNPKLNVTVRKLRALKHVAALFAVNAIAESRYCIELLNSVHQTLSRQLVSVKANAGFGKTQMSAQVTFENSDRPAGILLYGKDLHAGNNLDELTRRSVVISGHPVPSFEALLEAVNAAGQRSHRRLPIVIDGLNEAEDPRNWRPLLSSLMEVVKGYKYVMVVCTVRSHFVAESLPENADCLELSGFGRDIGAALRKYFEYYKIDASDADLPNILRHPLTLRIFCEVSNPSREQTVDVADMPQSLTALFDEYLRQAAERIAELASPSFRYYQPDVRNALLKLGTALWDRNSRFIPMPAIRQIMGDDDKPWDKSIVRALEQEGILLRYPREQQDSESVAVVYDLLAGHLVADAILRQLNSTNVEEWLQDPSHLAAIDVNHEGGHALATDTFRALAGLVPRRIPGRQLWTMLADPLRRSALRQAAKLESTYVNAETVDELAKFIIEDPVDGNDVFRRLLQTRGSLSHPLNARFLNRVLAPMTLPSRDVRWTEWVRKNYEEVNVDLKRLESRWRKERRNKSESKRLRAMWVMWLLASTVRELRDRATRTLFWFGWSDPVGLFRLTCYALTLTDPYVSERMLAAAYGVSMALHARPRRPKFRSVVLPKFAEEIYKRMFAPEAAFSTTHILSRDYARRIVELGCRHSPTLLTKQQKNSVKPPYKSGGIRKWESIEDPNGEKYRQGNAPLGMDFANYTIGGLVPERRNYDFDDEEYKKVLGQVYWRLYQLGYSYELFKDIDTTIANQRYFGRAERPPTERYGKKYGRIAYFELYGLRLDEGLVEKSWWADTERAIDIDIDPSFPDSPHKLHLVSNFLDSESISTSTWVKEGHHRFEQYLVQSKLVSESGPWILLDGHCSQRSKTLERNGFVRLQSFLILKEDLPRFAALIKRKPPKGRWLPDISEDHLTFAGEVPWCNSYPYSDLATIDFPIGVVQKRIPPNDPRRKLQIAFGVFGEAKKTLVPPVLPDFETVNVYERIPVYVPVRSNRFSADDVIARPGCTVLAKELAILFGLWIDLPTWDFRDGSSRLSAVALSDGESSNYEEHLFLRLDLLNELLNSQKLTLLWVIWGERQHYSERLGGHSRSYKNFKEVYKFANGSPKLVAALNEWEDE